LDCNIAPPSPPRDFSVLATDGSHIGVDRHRSAGCYLINVGKVRLRYGSQPDASLTSSPALYYREEDLAIASPDGQEGYRVEGAILGARRSIEECRALAEMAEGSDPDLPALALLDGSLILWDLEAQKYPDFVVHELLDGGLMQHLGLIVDVSRRRRLAFASYISSPRSTEVVNALRVALCPHDPPDCDRHCRGAYRAGRPCDEVGALRDADVLLRAMEDGRRSAVFRSRSSVVERHYALHKVYFFYVRVGDEIGRVEMPQWVAERDDLRGLAHSLVLDQCRRGDGYPVALSEAHQKAVVTAGDREQFWRLVEGALEEERLPLRTSAKSLSKRRPWV
jgi:hypothetical protein